MSWSEATRDSVVGIAAMGALVAIVALILNKFHTDSKDVVAILGVLGTMIGSVVGAVLGHVAGKSAGEDTGKKKTLADLKKSTAGKTPEQIAAHVETLTA